MAITSVSIPYHGAITDEMVPFRTEGPYGFLCYDSPSSHPAMIEDTVYAGQYLEMLFPDDLTVRAVPGKTFGVPARMECFWSDDGDRGIAIFDNQARLIVHILSALFGYEGSGPRLSRDILDHFGVSREVFIAIQREVWQNRPYKVVLSREKHGLADGVDTIKIGADVEPEWSWWRVH